jgi:hypothetical protein
MRLATRAPSPAERARSVLAGASSVRLGVVGLAHEVERHLVAQDGSLLLQPGAESPARVLALGGSVSAWVGTAVATDVTGTAHADRIRGRVTLTGPVEALRGAVADHVRDHLARARPSLVPVTGPILRLTPTRVHLEWRCGDAEPEARRAQVPLDRFRAAEPDPLVGSTDEVLDHLARTHGPLLRRLAESTVGDLEPGATVLPLLLDRFGLVLRIRRAGPAGTTYDVRVAFARPVACGCEATEALEELWSRTRRP